ncbi:MAG: hypothetical protein LBG58_08515 [Planctomycetaceae bacterium]|jgi:hypothetical protein|nr:hypothetical protein [Planctomycetaceae bacterium]
MGAKTRNNYRGAILNFYNWAVDHKLLAVNPFVKVPKAREASDRRHERRACNIPNDLEDHESYIASWIQCMKNDVRESLIIRNYERFPPPP